MDQYLQHYGKLIRYSLTGWPEFRKRLESEPHHRWGGEGADPELRAVAADAYQERDDIPSPEAEHGAALLRNPNEHVIIDGEGKVKRGRFSAVGVDQKLREFTRHLDHHIPYGYPNHWNVMELEHRPSWFTLEDANGHDTYNLSHHARYLPEQIADYLGRDVDHYESLDHLEPEHAEQARRILTEMRQSPTEVPHPNQELNQ